MVETLPRGRLIDSIRPLHDPGGPKPPQLPHMSPKGFFSELQWGHGGEAVERTRKAAGHHASRASMGPRR